jgi:hypothetical protein
MRWSMMCSVVLVGAAAVGCQQDASTAAAPAHAGTLTLALSANSRNGDAFRLREAVFHLYGCSDGWTYFPPNSGSAGSADPSMYAAQCVDQRFASENLLDQMTITQRVLPGDYSVMMEGDWYMEQQVDGTWTRVDKVVLLSTPLQQTHVYDGGSTQISYLFGVGGDAIDFRHGDLGIGIQVERPGDDACINTPHAGTGEGLPPGCLPGGAGMQAVAGAGLGAAGMGVPAGNGAAGN